MGSTKLSGLQKQVLSLYREFLRAARSKSIQDRRQMELVVSQEFHRNATQVDRKNFIYIEYLLRRGKKQLDQLKSSDTLSLSFVKPACSDAKLIHGTAGSIRCISSVEIILPHLVVHGYNTCFYC